MRLALVGKGGSGENNINVNGIMHTTTQTIQETYKDLRRQNDLSPRNPLVNELLGKLVTELSTAHNTVEGDEFSTLFANLSLEYQALPAICATAECEMEKFWARKFLHDPHPVQLNEFWYFQNYKALWELEKSLLGGYISAQRLVFLGAGSLPLSAILAAQEFPGITIDCVDFDPEACDLAQRLIAALNLETRIKVQCQQAQNYFFKANDLVLCASLIQGKEEVYECLYKANISQFLVRDAEGMYCFLYSPSPMPKNTQFQELGKTFPTPECINTTRLFRRCYEKNNESLN